MSRAAHYRFDRFELLPAQRQLLADGRPLKLGSRAFDLLLALVQRRDRVVLKGELLDLVWPDAAVEEANLAVQVLALRQALGRDAIATVPGRGYRFVRPVHGPEALPTAGVAVPAGLVTGARPALPPARSGALIGRDEDVAALRQLIEQRPLVTLLGTAGVGKTTLALAVAHTLQVAFAAGVWWVELAALSEAERVVDVVAQVLKVTPAAADACQAVADALRQGRQLLVLDNAEQVAGVVAALVAALRARAPQAHVLVTSQEPLRLAGEQCLRLAPLSLPVDDSLAAHRRSGATALFEARARALDPRFEVDAARAPAVADICRRLDGIPLAIELAAARLPLLGLEGLRQRLDERLRLLSVGAGSALPRHQTLHAALAWSHGLLPAEAQRVFRRLGVFAGGFTLESAQRVAADAQLDAWDVLEQLGVLVDRSLVVAEGDALPRYRLLESARLFALERLAEADELASVREQHARALDALLTVTREDPQQLWRTPPAPSPQLVAELDNVRAALDWAAAAGDDALALSLAAGASHAFLAAALNAEYLQRVLPLRARVAATTPAPLAARLWSRIAFAAGRNAHPAGLDAGLRAIEAWRALGDAGRLYDALTWTIAIGARHGQVAPLQPLIDEGLRIERSDWPPALRSSFRWARHRWLQMQGRTGEALQCALEQAELLAQDGHWAMHVAWGANVADCETALGRLESAERHARESLQALDALGIDENIVGHVMDALVVTLVLQGRVDEAVPVARRARRLLEREGDDLRLLEPLALGATHQGRWAAAACLVGHVDAAMARSGESHWPSARHRREQLQRRLDAALSPAARREHRRAGAALSRDAAFALAFGEVDPQAPGC